MEGNLPYFLAALAVTLAGLGYYVYTLDARLRGVERELERLEGGDGGDGKDPKDCKDSKDSKDAGDQGSRGEEAPLGDG